MSNAARPLSHRRILVVEDEYLIAMDVKRWLMAAGATVVGPVPSVERALGLIEEGYIDAAVLDINLGERGTSFPIADRLSALGVPYLFATGDVQVSLGSLYGGQPRLEKPFVEAELVQAVAKLTSVP
ncbi:response regulator [Methylobacterium fujisawaense]|uniref:response regulator n=1 Tax=Methylobacterium fujisawaense TaxID=107400 RepID=UPI00313AA666